MYSITDHHPSLFLLKYNLFTATHSFGEFSLMATAHHFSPGCTSESGKGDLKMRRKTSQGMLETSSHHLTVLPLASPERCHALGSESTVSRAGQLWPAPPLKGHLWSLASQLGPFPFHSLPAALHFLPGPLAQFQVLSLLVDPFHVGLTLSLPFSRTEEALEFSAAKGKN